MNVKCLKCKAKLRVTNENIRSDGSSIKCPECGSVIYFSKTTTPKEAIEKPGIQRKHLKLKYSSDIANEIILQEKKMNRIYLLAILWSCRLIPIIIWIGLFIFILFGTEINKSISYQAIFWGILFPFSLLYILLVYNLIPGLFPEKQERTIEQKIRDYFLISVSAGLYVVFEYWKKVDPSLSRMLRESKQRLGVVSTIKIIFGVVLVSGLIIGLIISSLMEK